LEARNMEPADQTVERRALEAAVANQSHLRGLGLVPVGLMFILFALALWGVGPLRQLWVFPVAVLVLMLAPALWIDRYYDEHYGRFTPSSRHEGRQVAAFVARLVVGVPFLIGVAWLLRSEEPWSLDLPVNPVLVVWAIAMLAVSAPTVGLRHRHRAVIGGSAFVAGLLPVWSGPDPTPIGLVLVGVATMAMGILSHRLLVKTFGSPADRGLEARDAGA
jgi:hypothetical protein